MRNLPPDYLAEIARQLAFVSAFLGGFAATFLATLLVADAPGKVAGWTIGSAALSSAAFIVAVSASVMLVIVLHPDAPDNITTNASISGARAFSVLGFMVGIYALLLGLGLSGWIRSRSVGIATSLAASCAAVVVTWVVAGG